MDTEEPPPIAPKKKKNLSSRIFVVLVIIFMASWALAEWNPLEKKEEPENLITVGSYDFYQLEDDTFGTYLKITEDKKIPIAFRLDPRNASAIAIDDGIPKKILSSNKIYIAFDPNAQKLQWYGLAAVEISRITGQVYNIETVGAYTKDSNPINPDIPLKTCDDATKNNLVIVLRTAATGESNEVDMVGDCIIVIGQTPEDIVLSADKLGMHLVGIKI